MMVMPFVGAFDNLLPSLTKHIAPISRNMGDDVVKGFSQETARFFSKEAPVPSTTVFTTATTDDFAKIALKNEDFLFGGQKTSQTIRETATAAAVKSSNITTHQVKHAVPDAPAVLTQTIGNTVVEVPQSFPIIGEKQVDELVRAWQQPVAPIPATGSDQVAKIIHSIPEPLKNTATAVTRLSSNSQNTTLSNHIMEHIMHQNNSAIVRPVDMPINNTK
jgi:hypothetical protein